MPTVFGHSVGPTGGHVAVRNGAGYRAGTISIFSGSSPGNFTRITPSMTQAQIQDAIDTDTTGKIWWEKGTYRGPWSISDSAVFRLYTRPNQEHRFQTGPLRTAADTAILQGSEGVTGWVTGSGADAGYWYVTGQTQDFQSRHNNAGPDPYHNDYTPTGHNLEAYYRDGVILYPAATKAAVLGRSDSVFFDRTAGRAWLGSNPSGHTLERLADFGFIFRVRQPGISFKGGIFRHAGFSMLRVESLGGLEPHNFLLEDAELCYGRLECFRVFGSSGNETDGIRVSHCTIHHGGRYNFGATWNFNMTVEYCDLHHGNALHFGNRVVGTFDEGSDKTLFTENFRYHHNWMHDTDGPGAWPDTDCNNWVFEDNVVEHIYGAGIHYEQNSGATIRRNLFNDCQMDGNQPAPFDGSAPGWPTIGGWRYKGGGTWLSVAEDIEMYDNWFYNNKHAAIYMRQDFTKPSGRVYNLVNASIHHNRVDHWDSASAEEYMISYRDSRAILPVPTEVEGYSPTADEEPYSVYMARANNIFNFNDYHVRGAGREDAPTRPVDAWFFAPSGLNKNFTQWRQGFVVQSPTEAAGPGSQGTPPSHHDPSSSFASDLPATPPNEPVDSSDGSIFRDLTPVVETDTALPVTNLQIIPVGQVTEVDSPLGVSAVVVSGPGATQIIATVEETDTAQPVAARTRGEWSATAEATTFADLVTHIIGMVTETDTALGLEGFAVFMVEELDEALPVDLRLRGDWTGPVTATTLEEESVEPVVTLNVGQVTETDTALVVTVTSFIPPAVEVDTTFLAASLDAVLKVGDYDPVLNAAGTSDPAIPIRGDHDVVVGTLVVVYTPALALGGSYVPTLALAGSL